MNFIRVVFLSQQVSHSSSFFYQSFFIAIFAPGGFNSFPESDDIILDTKEDREEKSDQEQKGKKENDESSSLLPLLLNAACSSL